MSETMQVGILLLVTFGLFVFMVLSTYVARLVRVYGPWSARFSAAGASTILTKKIGRLMGSGVELIMPVGLGKYPLVVDSKIRKMWEETFRKWVKLGAQIKIVMTSGDVDAVSYWSNLGRELDGKLSVFTLNKELASGKDAIEIKRLDTFHPVLLLRNGEPLAMWIENYHPTKSNKAYNVEYVAQKDIVRNQKIRFDRILSVLRHLMEPKGKGDNRHKAKLKEPGLETTAEQNYKHSIK